MRRVLNQVANAAVKTKGSVFQSLYRRSYRAWGTARPFGRLPIASVIDLEDSARSSRLSNLEKNAIRKPCNIDSPNSPGNFARLATKTPHH
jgi:hypothetical protein